MTHLERKKNASKVFKASFLNFFIFFWILFWIISSDSLVSYVRDYDCLLLTYPLALDWQGVARKESLGKQPQGGAIGNGKTQAGDRVNWNQTTTREKPRLSFNIFIPLKLRNFFVDHTPTKLRIFPPWTISWHTFQTLFEIFKYWKSKCSSSSNWQISIPFLSPTNNDQYFL